MTTAVDIRKGPILTLNAGKGSFLTLNVRIGPLILAAGIVPVGCSA